MNKTLLAIVALSLMASFQAEAQSRGSGTQTGAFRACCQDSGSYTQYPKAGQRRPEQIDVSTKFPRASSYYLPGWKARMVQNRDPRRSIQTNNRASRLNKNRGCSGKAPCQR